MRSMALATAAQLPAVISQASDFNIHGLRVFSSIPEHRDYGIAALKGLVVIYDEQPLHTEGVMENAFYVRESQHTPSLMAWEKWLQSEWEDRARRAQPTSPLKTRREIVQAIRWPYEDKWSVRLFNGRVDGPYHDWAFGRDFVGKVVGFYQPN